MTILIDEEDTRLSKLDSISLEYVMKKMCTLL